MATNALDYADYGEPFARIAATNVDTLDYYEYGEPFWAEAAGLTPIAVIVLIGV